MNRKIIFLYRRDSIHNFKQKIAFSPSGTLIVHSHLIAKTDPGEKIHPGVCAWIRASPRVVTTALTTTVMDILTVMIGRIAGKIFSAGSIGF
jgi:hypothetical protein